MGWMQQGLLDEVVQLVRIAQRSDDNSLNFTTGIFQSIGDNITSSQLPSLADWVVLGYREFHTYLTSGQETEKAYNTAVDAMKVSTRQYAKRQVSWIRNKLLPAVYAWNVVAYEPSQDVVMYLLDATGTAHEIFRIRDNLKETRLLDHGEQWVRNVRDIAVNITTPFLTSQPLPDPLAISDRAKTLLSIKPKSIEYAGIVISSPRRKLT